MAAENESGFLIDGKVYEVPTLDSLDMAERRVMYDLCGVVQEDFLREPDETAAEHTARTSKLMRHPGFMEALMQVAYQRGNPDAKERKVRLVIEQTNYMDALSTLGGDEQEEDALPLALTTEPARSSQSDSPGNESLTRESSGNGGSGSGNGSAVQAEIRRRGRCCAVTSGCFAVTRRQWPVCPSRSRRGGFPSRHVQLNQAKEDRKWLTPS